MIKDKDFYNRESSHYSSKRYPRSASTYVQYFFKKRLESVLNLLENILEGKNNLDLLEIGCADGIVVREISNRMGGAFSSFVGIDTAEDMIKTAESLNTSTDARFFVRGSEPSNKMYDVIIEIGVANYTDFEAEMRYASEHMKENGTYILSIAGSDSSNKIFGRGIGYQNFLLYSEYELIIGKLFKIDSVIPVGLYFPLIWTVPVLGRAIQTVMETFVRPMAPDLFHEKVYVLYSKS